MKNLVLLLLLVAPILINAQEKKLHSVKFITAFDGGNITRSVTFYLLNGDTLAESTYLINYYDGNKLDEVDVSPKIPYKIFIESDKAGMIKFLHNKLQHAIRDKYDYSYEIIFPNLWYQSAMNSTFKLKIIHNNKIYSFLFDILTPPDTIRDQINQTIK